MGRFECLTEDSYATIKKLNRKEIISDGAYKELEDCKCIREERRVILKFYKISELELKDLMWNFVMNWNDKRGKENDTTFNQEQSKFVKKLLLHNGVYSRDECQREILTDQQIRNQITALEDMDIVICIRTKKAYDNKSLYIIHPKQLIKLRESKKI